MTSGTVRILYVDDESELLEIGKLYLEDEPGFFVDCARSGEDAIEYISSRQYDVVVSDYQMPKMNGISLLKTVRAKGVDIPFILFTGKGREDVVIDAINHGADFYLQKGGDPDAQFAELAHKIRKSVERKQGEGALQESERRYRNLYQYALVGLFETRLRDGIIIACNQRYCDLFGFSSVENALGKEVTHLYEYPGDRGVVNRILREQGQISNHEVRFINQLTGHRFWGQFSARVNTEKDVAEGTIIDITDRKDAEESLKESQRALATLMINLPGMAYRCRNDLKWTMEFVSDGCTELTGFHPSDLVENGTVAFADLIHPEDRVRVWNQIQDSVRKQEKFQVFYRILTAEGSEKSVWEQGLGVFSPEGKLQAIEGFVIDITDRKRLEADLEREQRKLQMSCDRLAEREQALRINEERLRMAQRISRAGSWEYDVASRTIWGSDEGLSIFGYPPVAGEIPLENIESCIPERERVHNALADMLAKGTEYDIEYLIHPADGSEPKVIHSMAMLERDGMGNPVRIRGIVQDITARKRVDEENWHARQLLEGILNSLHVRVFWKDRNLIYLGCNTPFAHDAGFEKPADIIGRDDYAMGWRDLADLYRSDDREVIESKMPKLFIEEPQKTPSGDTISLLTTKIPLRDAEGNVTGVLGTYIDITRRRQAEDSLRESEERYRAVAEFTYDWEYWMAPDGRIIYTSPSCERITGHRPEEFALDPGLIVSITHPVDRNIIVDHLSLAHDHHQNPGFLEFRIITRTGDERWIGHACTPVYDAHGNYLGRRACNRDITVQKQAERALAAANEKLTLLSGITRHDIANQLTTLVGYRNLLEKKIPDPQFTEYFQKIDKAAQRIGAMIRFTKEYETIGIRAPAWQDCQTLIETAAAEAPLGNVVVKNQVPPGTEVSADPLISKVFYCLMDNAVLYGGKITTICFSARYNGDDLVIVCEDDGAGVPAQEKELIFDQGFGKNTGLGLTLSREILNITGITIRETGEPCAGARFEMKVPKGIWRTNRRAE